VSEPVELTEAEREGLIEAVQDGTEDAYVARIKAAARREALLEAAEELDAQPSYRESGLFGHERDYADGKDSEAERISDWLRVLAEPERDEESGR
jgi:hypothetical protein